eukprot:scaffold4479_cov46-Cyclotella_meneghiniana.AAC.3
MEPFWKVIEMIMERRLQAIQLHNCLHGSVQRRGTGTAILKAKLVQQLAYLRQTLLYEVFIDLRKAYDAMDRRRTLMILEAYGAGPNMLHLIERFWDLAMLVCKAHGRYGEPFKSFRGVTQGGPLSPKIFNILVDAIVREWLRQILGDEAAAEGVGAAVSVFLALFYIDDGVIASIDPEYLQEAIDILVDLFEHVGLNTNTKKTEAITCIPGRIRTRQTDESYTRSQLGFATAKEWDSRRTACDICGKELSAKSMPNHLETVHDVYRSRVINRDLVVRTEARNFNAHISADGKYYCPVPGCIGEGVTKWNLRRHFRDHHPRDYVSIPGEGVYPKCMRCGMQTNPTATRHTASQLCKDGKVKLQQLAASIASARSLDVVFTACGEDLEQVEVFKYLGRLMSMDDNDIQAVRKNPSKARKSWRMLSRLLREENAEPRVCGMFYKAVIQLVLLYGSETSALTATARKCLEGFHIRSAYRMARVHKPTRNPDGSWTHPASAGVLEEVGLYSIDHYIGVRRQTVANYIRDRPIFDIYRNESRRPGTSPRLMWWEQPLSEDLARADDNDLANVVIED